MKNNCLEIYNLDFLDIFNNFSICFEKNKIISISGPNKSGKTSLVRMMDKQIKTNNNILLEGIYIDEYKVTDYYKKIKTVIPKELQTLYETVDEEINYYADQLFLSKDEKLRRMRNMYKILGLNKIKKDPIKTLSDQDIVKVQLACAIISNPRILVIDDISPYFNIEDATKIVEYLRDLVRENNMTVILMTGRLDETLYTDYLYILQNSSIVIEGKPEDVLQKDNILNKAGLRVPFMVDLSTKLKDYDLIDNIELDMERLIARLWN